MKQHQFHISTGLVLNTSPPVSSSGKRPSSSPQRATPGVSNASHDQPLAPSTPTSARRNRPNLNLIVDVSTALTLLTVSPTLSPTLAVYKSSPTRPRSASVSPSKAYIVRERPTDILGIISTDPDNPTASRQLPSTPTTALPVAQLCHIYRPSDTSPQPSPIWSPTPRSRPQSAIRPTSSPAAYSRSNNSFIRSPNTPLLAPGPLLQSPPPAHPMPNPPTSPPALVQPSSPGRLLPLPVSRLHKGLPGPKPKHYGGYVRTSWGLQGSVVSYTTAEDSTGHQSTSQSQQPSPRPLESCSTASFSALTVTPQNGTPLGTTPQATPRAQNQPRALGESFPKSHTAQTDSTPLDAPAGATAMLTDAPGTPGDAAGVGLDVLTGTSLLDNTAGVDKPKATRRSDSSPGDSPILSTRSSCALTPTGQGRRESSLTGMDSLALAFEQVRQSVAGQTLSDAGTLQSVAQKRRGRPETEIAPWHTATEPMDGLEDDLSSYVTGKTPEPGMSNCGTATPLPRVSTASVVGAHASSNPPSARGQHPSRTTRSTSHTSPQPSTSRAPPASGRTQSSSPHWLGETAPRSPELERSMSTSPSTSNPRALATSNRTVPDPRAMAASYSPTPGTTTAHPPGPSTSSVRDVAGPTRARPTSAMPRPKSSVYSKTHLTHTVTTQQHTSRSPAVTQFTITPTTYTTSLVSSAIPASYSTSRLQSSTGAIHSGINSTEPLSSTLIVASVTRHDPQSDLAGTPLELPPKIRRPERYQQVMLLSLHTEEDEADDDQSAVQSPTGATARSAERAQLYNMLRAQQAVSKPNILEMNKGLQKPVVTEHVTPPHMIFGRLGCNYQAQTHAQQVHGIPTKLKLVGGHLTKTLPQQDMGLRVDTFRLQPAQRIPYGEAT